MFRLADDQFIGLFFRAEHGFVDLYIFPERPIIESQRQWESWIKVCLLNVTLYTGLFLSKAKENLIFPFGEANRTLLFAYKVSAKYKKCQNEVD